MTTQGPPAPGSATARIAAAFAPWANRHNVRSFRGLDEAGRLSLAQTLAREAGIAGHWRWAYNTLAEA